MSRVANGIQFQMFSQCFDMTAIVSVNLLHTLHHHHQHHRRLLFGLEMNRQVRTSALYILVANDKERGKGEASKKSRYCTSFKKNAPALTKRFGLTALHKQQIVTTVFGVVATLKEGLLSFSLKPKIELKFGFPLSRYSQRHIFQTKELSQRSQTIKHKQNFTIKLRFILTRWQQQTSG